jgi:hypothetical protein
VEDVEVSDTLGGAGEGDTFTLATRAVVLTRMLPTLDLSWK